MEGTKTIELVVNSGKLDTSGANAPVLDSAMIPVYYDESSFSWKKADEKNQDENNKWYDYNNKMWANSVTVSSDNRSKYLSASVGTEIPMDDILTMQVWIPRYKYKVWNYNSSGETSSEPQQIEIMFEKGTNKTGDISCVDNIQGSDVDGTSEVCKLNNTVCTDSTCNGKTYTHPAFTFGNKEIQGFWIGKFEITGAIDSITTHPASGSIGEQLVSDFEISIMNMNSSSNEYGFSTNIDIHMIKNSEWGAVAYLSHSKYGTCTDGTCKKIGINNNSNFITGCGAAAGSYSSTTCNAYNTTTGMLASTTQNIYGVYDMSGGAYEYTMGNMVSEDGKTMLVGDSGFDTYPAEKYYDKYSYSVNGDELQRSKLGDGIKEIYAGSYGWYNNEIFVTYFDSSWFLRGGGYEYGSSAGVFYSENWDGSGRDGFSSRIIIIP